MTENKNKIIIIFMITLSIIFLIGYIVRGFNIRHLKEVNHNQEQLLITNDSEKKMLNIQINELKEQIKEYKRMVTIDSIYYKIYNDYEKIDF